MEQAESHDVGRLSSATEIVWVARFTDDDFRTSFLLPH